LNHLEAINLEVGPCYGMISHTSEY